MADIKTTTMRLSEDTIKCFREIAEKEGFTQEQCLFQLITTFHMQKAKEIIVDRKKEIETFEDYISKLLNLYVNSLEMNINAEASLKTRFTEDIESKEVTILSLNEDIKKMKSELIEKDRLVNTLDVENQKIIKDYEDIKLLINQNKDLLNKLEDEKSTLKEDLLKVANYSSENITLKKEVKDLLNQIDDINLLLRKKELINENLNSQLVISKQNYMDLKEEVKNEKSNLLYQFKELSNEHKKECESLEFKFKIEFEKKLTETLEIEKCKLETQHQRELLSFEKELYILRGNKEKKEK